jgi:dUTP pyrophosphatase
MKKEEVIKNSIEDYPKFDLQISKDKERFDLTVSKISKISGKGAMDFSDNERILPEKEEIKPEKKNQDDKYRWWNLSQGTYRIKTNEKISLPENTSARIYSRACFLETGAFIVPCFLGKGYKGQPEFTLIVQNPEGLDIKENARILELVLE